MFFDDFYDFLEMGFGKPMKLKFNVAGTKDVMPACWNSMKDKDGTVTGYKCTCRTVGIDEKDVKISVNEENIVVEGKTEYEGEKYDTHFELPVAEAIMNDIKSIDYKTINGLTYIYLRVEPVQKKKININKI